MQHSFTAVPGSTSRMPLQTVPSSSSIVLTRVCADAPATASSHPRMRGGTVSSSKFSSQGVQPLPAGSSRLLPLGTIIMPANYKLPPGSLVLPQGNLPGGQLRLALPSQLPVQPPLSHPPTHLHTSAEAAAVSVDGTSAALMIEPAPGGQEEVNAHFSSHLANSNDCAVVTDAAAAADQAVLAVSRGQYLHSSSEAAHAVLPVRAQHGFACGIAAEPQSTNGDGLDTDAVSMTASEGTSTLGKLLLLLQAA